MTEMEQTKRTKLNKRNHRNDKNETNPTTTLKRPKRPQRNDRNYQNNIQLEGCNIFLLYKYRLRFPIELAKVPFISSIIKKYLAF